MGVNSVPSTDYKKELEAQDSESFRIFLRMNEASKHVVKSRTHPGKNGQQTAKERVWVLTTKWKKQMSDRLLSVCGNALVGEHVRLGQ